MFIFINLSSNANKLNYNSFAGNQIFNSISFRISIYREKSRRWSLEKKCSPLTTLEFMDPLQNPARGYRTLPIIIIDASWQLSAPLLPFFFFFSGTKFTEKSLWRWLLEEKKKNARL